jgi:hypothetical protein
MFGVLDADQDGIFTPLDLDKIGSDNQVDRWPYILLVQYGAVKCDVIRVKNDFRVQIEKRYR